MHSAFATAGVSALKARAIGGAVGNGALYLTGGVFSEISKTEARQALLDFHEGKQGAGYRLATSLLDTGAGASAELMAWLAAIGETARLRSPGVGEFLGKAARPFSLAAGALTIASLAAHAVANSIAEKNGSTPSTPIRPGTPAGQVVTAAARRGPLTNDTQPARTVVV